MALPDLNGTWSFLGLATPDPTLPFIGFNYSLDPSLFPSTTTGHTFQYEVSAQGGCAGSAPSIVQMQVTIEETPSAGTLPVNPIQICLDGTAIDLNFFIQFQLQLPFMHTTKSIIQD